MTTRSDVSWRCAGRDRCMYALIYKRVHSYTYSCTHEYWIGVKRVNTLKIHYTPILCLMALSNLIINHLNQEL